MKRASVIGLIVLLSILFGACTPVPTPAPQAIVPAEPTKASMAAPTEAPKPAATQPPAPEPTAVPEVKKGGELVIGMYAGVEPPTLDGQIASSQWGWLINSMVADPLMIWKADGTYEGALVEKYEANDDNSVHTFYLKKDLKFQDGTAVNAEAVQWNFDRLKDPNTKSMNFANSLGASNYTTEVVDEYTFKLTYDIPFPSFLSIARRYPIWSPTAVQKYGEDYPNHLTGHGPYTLKEYVANDHVTLEKWADYPGTNPIQDHEGPAYLDTIRFNFIGERSVLGKAVMTGDVHISMNPPIQNALEYKDETVGKPEVFPQIGGGMAWIINTSKPPFDQLEVRQALLYATNPEQANDIAFDGQYPLLYGPLTTAHPCYWSGVEDFYKTDLDKANQLLEEAGWKDNDGDGIREAQGVPGVADGEKLTFEMYSYTDQFQVLMEELQMQWSEVGFDTKVLIVPNPVQLEKALTGEFNVIINYSVKADPSLLVDMWFSEYAGQPGHWSWSRLNIPELDGYLKEIMDSGDLDYRCNVAAHEAQRIIMENAGCIPVVDMPTITVVHNKVKGLMRAPEGQWLYINNVYIEE